MTIRVLEGDCRSVLLTLPAASVQCCVTSPPYFGLRDYGVAGQIGLEASPDAFVAEMVAVFREVRRVLRDDGTLWLNLGDSYATSPPGNKPNTTALSSGLPNSIENQEMRRSAQSLVNKSKLTGFKPKDLMMIPARVALALQTDGWWLRSDIIWSKPNPMPESVTDRPTSAHEHVFLLTKSPRYFWDAEAVREPLSDVSLAQIDFSKRNAVSDDIRAKGVISGRDDGGNKLLSRVGSASRGAAMNPVGRNCRNVWTIATQPFSEAHFATFPPALAERCIKAGSRPGDTILDPFAGAFTSLLVADRLQRHGIGIELNPAYAEMARNRLVKDAGMFAEISA